MCTIGIFIITAELFDADECPDGFPATPPSINISRFLPYGDLYPNKTRFWKEQFERTASQRSARLSSMLSERLGVGAKGTVILMVFNRGYSWMFFNFVCGLEQRAIDTAQLKRRLLIVVTDAQSERVLSAHGFMTYRPRFTSFIDEGAMNFGDGGFEETVTLQMLLAVDVLQLGFDALLQDVDVVWNRDPLRFLQRQSAVRNIDIQMAFSGRSDAHGPGNTGFMFIRSNCKTRVLGEAMRALALTTLSGGIDDQTLWNALIHEKAFRQIQLHILDAKRFINGHRLNLRRELGRFARDDIDANDEHFVFHASWTWDQFDKIEKYFNMRHWYFTQTHCAAFYDARLIPDLSHRKYQTNFKEMQKAQERKFVELGIFRRA